MALSDYDFENILSHRYNEAHNSPTRERVEIVRALMKDPRGPKLLKKWSTIAGDQVRQLLDPTLGELIIRIGEAERTRNPEPKQALKAWVSQSRELRAALDRIPVFRERYKLVTKAVKVKPLDPGFERLEKAVAKAFGARVKDKRPAWLGGVFEQEFFYLAMDGEPEKVRDAALSRAFRDAIDEPIEGADDDAIDALRRLAALVALGRFLRRQKAREVTLSGDLEAPRRQVKLARIPELGRTRERALDALCAKPESKQLFERLLTKGKGALLPLL